MIRLTALLSSWILLVGCQTSEPEQSSLETGGLTTTDEEVIPLDEVPTAALAAAEKAVPGVTFDRAERETEEGRVVYGLEGTLDGVRHEVEVTADGDVIEVESGDEEDDDDDEDDEEEIALEDVPADILAAAEAAVPGVVFSKAYTETEDGQKVYELVGEADGERVEVEVSTDAKVLEIERGEDD
ncbi:MAG: PepSY domain-containing protein [Planctomycetota bacterium]